MIHPPLPEGESYLLQMAEADVRALTNEVRKLNEELRSERADVLAYLDHAVSYPNLTPKVRTYLSMLRELFADKAHLGWSKSQGA